MYLCSTAAEAAETGEMPEIRCGRAAHSLPPPIRVARKNAAIVGVDAAAAGAIAATPKRRTPRPMAWRNSRPSSARLMCHRRPGTSQRRPPSNCTGTSDVGMKLVIFAADDIE